MDTSMGAWKSSSWSVKKLDLLLQYKEEIFIQTWSPALRTGLSRLSKSQFFFADCYLFQEMSSLSSDLSTQLEACLLLHLGIAATPNSYPGEFVTWHGST